MKIPATLTAEQASRRRWEAVVVGAGPAGAVAARQMALRDMSVLLVDRRGFPRDKVCGGCLGVGALDLLQDIELDGLVDRLGAVPLRSFRLAGWGRSATLALPGGASVSRWSFDAALVREAIVAGADFVPGANATLGTSGSSERRVRLRSAGDATEVSAKIVVAADGLGSGLMADGDPAVARASVDSRIGAATILDDEGDRYRSGTVYMAVGDGGYVGIVRLEDGRLNVAAALDKAAVRNAGGPGRAAARILEGAGMPEIGGVAHDEWRGTRRLTRRNAPVAAERVLAAGDAGGYIEPFTGEGIGWAIAAAVRVADFAQQAVDGWHPGLEEAWRKTHRRTIGRSQRFCRGLVWLLRKPAAARLALRALATSPSLGRPFVRRLQATGRWAYEAEK